MSFVDVAKSLDRYPLRLFINGKFLVFSLVNARHLLLDYINKSDLNFPQFRDLKNSEINVSKDIIDTLSI